MLLEFIFLKKNRDIKKMYIKLYNLIKNIFGILKKYGDT